MMVKISMLTISTSSFIVSFMGFANTAVSPQTDEQWRTVIENDIQAAYNITAQNHPGMFDANNPAFPDLLKKAKAEMQKKYDLRKLVPSKISPLPFDQTQHLT